MKLLAESLQEYRHQNLEEGVADKYAAQKFGIQDEEDDFEKQYQQHKSTKKGNTVAEVKGSQIIKNPSDLKSFPPGSRGVITKDGDLYLSNDVENVIHTDILKALIKKGILPSSAKPTGWEDPNDLEKNGFVTVQQVWNKPAFAVGESYMIPKPRKEEERKAALLNFKPFFEAAQKKNPNLKFVYNQPRSAARKMLSSDEYEKYKTLGS